MSVAEPTRSIGISTVVLERVKAFEEAWLPGQQPPIEDFLPAQGPERLPCLVALIQVALERRLRADGSVRVEEFLDRFPDLRGDPAILKALVRAEYLGRLQRGEQVALAEYAGRFPQLGELDGLLLNLETIAWPILPE